jgi:hypothetical protein
MIDVLTLACPKCGIPKKVEFPPSFFFGRAVLECEFCNLKLEGSGDNNFEASEDLMENIKDWKIAEAAV